ncbi:MAG TPA: HlyD family secretion protein [Rhizomicrobium sp.]|nr:HlyD family secretion protein [Rhizomicrobium sp.]
MATVESSNRIRGAAFDTAPDKTAAKPVDRAFLRRVLMLSGVILVAAASAYFYLTGGRYVSSDDSYVHGNKLMVSTDVSGLIQSVNVKEGQQVKKGDVLFSLDPKPFEIALDNARAMLAQATQDVESARATYRAALGQIEAQKAQVALTKQTYDRYAALATQNAIAATTVDQARGAMLSAQATLVSLQQTAATDLAKLNGDPNMPVEKSPGYLKAKVAADEAQRQLDHTVVRAPFDGVVSEVDSLQPGTLVISAMSAFTTTSAVGLIGKDTWIESDMKETDLTHVHPGNPVDIAIDTYPGCHWSGHVENVSAGSDSSFSALPAENASGNWVKVVQRIPVRVAVDKSGCNLPLRVGMSAVISIDTGKRRWQRLMNE